MAQHSEAAIEVDPVLLENEFSDYESSGYSTDTVSLTSSVHEYIFENGRRYHAYFGIDKNPLPTDELEQERLDMHHEILLLLLKGELHKAPLPPNPQRILDIGTGTGIWAVDMAAAYPSAEVIGTDLSPMQPKWVPPNCRFIVDDAERLEWDWYPDSFDLVHCRNLAQSICDWPRLLSQAYVHVKPGGYIEWAEIGGTCHSDDNSLEPDNPISIFCNLLCKAMELLGRPADSAVGSKMVQRLLDAGFEDVHVFNVKQPFGPWAKDKRLKYVGALGLLQAETAYHAYGMAAFTRVLGMQTEEAERICEAAVKAHRNKNWHIYNYFYVVYGRKPGGEQEDM